MFLTHIFKYSLVKGIVGGKVNMSPFGTCVCCDGRFHYSEVSELTVVMDMAGLETPDVCMFCEQLIQNA